MLSTAKKALAMAVATVTATATLAAPASAAPTATAATERAATERAATERAATERAATERARPAGVWDIQVTRPGASYPGVFRFSGHFTACSGDGAIGLWWPTGRDSFSYKMIGKLNNPDGTQFGWIEINQNATLTGDTYAGSGIHYVYDTAWTKLATVEVVITGARSQQDAPC